MFNITKYKKTLSFLLDIAMMSAIYFSFFAFAAIIYPNPVPMSNIIVNYFVLIACTSFCMWAFKLYDSLWRYAEIEEYVLLILAMMLDFLIYFVTVKFAITTRVPFPYAVTFFSFTILSMLSVRYFYRVKRSKKNSIAEITKNVVIIGAGEAGSQLVLEYKRNSESNSNVIGIFDDDYAKIGKSIHRIPVYGPISKITDYCTDNRVDEIIIAMPSAGNEQKRRIISICASIQCTIKILPDYLAFIPEYKNALMSNARNVEIGDLLGRDSVDFDDAVLNPLIRNKTVLVTGGGGSIGSELCRQIAVAAPKKLIILDIYENNAYDLQMDLNMKYGTSLNLAVEIASVREKEKIDSIFAKYSPDLVFHAAAHKHVPLMEDNADEAVKNNIFGTYNVALSAKEHNVQKFVLISTDKAVNPTNVMGATKRFCEMMIQSMGESGNTTFAAVRFGNVLGSNGSVIPLFERQIRSGGPVTITDKRIIRYFMTIPEAAQLVLQAGAMARQSEIFVLNMGEPVKIYDLAQSVIRLSGYTPGVDMDIVTTGLRPGEKLYEELLMDNDNLHSTVNEKIFIEKQPAVSFDEIHQMVLAMQDILSDGNITRIRSTLKQFVPTYTTAADTLSEI